ncbi:MAG: tetratricopeptide repeat protein [bacterium]
MKHFQRGKRLYRKEKFREAVAEFRKAFEILPHRNILLNISICHAEMGDPVESVVQLRAALRLAGKNAEELLDPREYAKLLKMKKRVAVLTVVAPDLGAVIFVNGESTGASKVDRVVLPGSYRVDIQLDGKTKVNRRFELKPGAEERWVIQDWDQVATQYVGPRKSKRRLGRLHVAYVSAAAVLTLAAGLALVGTGVKTKSLDDEYAASGGDPDIKALGERYKTATNVLIGVTSIAAVTTVLLAIFTDWSLLKKKKKSASETTFAPIVGPDAAGFVWSGRF